MLAMQNRAASDRFTDDGGITALRVPDCELIRPTKSKSQQRRLVEDSAVACVRAQHQAAIPSG